MNLLSFPRKRKSGLPRQFRASHQEFIDPARALASFADRPDHKGLAAQSIGQASESEPSPVRPNKERRGQ